MRLDKFTIKSQEAISEAQSKAQEFGHQEVGVEHLLAALLDQDAGVVTPILNSYLAPKMSSFCVANLRNSQLLRAIRALNPFILDRNLLRPE